MCQGKSTAAGRGTELKGITWAKSAHLMVSLILWQLLILGKAVPLTRDSAEETRPECSQDKLIQPCSGASDELFSLTDRSSWGCHNMGLKPHTNSQEEPAQLLRTDCETWKAALHLPEASTSCRGQ